MRRISRKHDTVAVALEDPLEREIPKMGLVDFEDPETGDLITVDTSSTQFRRDYEAFLKASSDHRRDELRRANVQTSNSVRAEIW